MELQEIMEQICRDLGYYYISDLRKETNQEEILQYLIEHKINYKDKETYTKLMIYIME